MSVPTENIREAIKIYENSVKNALNVLDKQLLIAAGWTGGTAVVATVGVLFNNFIPVITALGFGGIVAAKRGKETINIFTQYLKHRQYLTTSVDSVKVELAISQLSNPPDYSSVITKLRSNMNNLSYSHYSK